MSGEEEQAAIISSEFYWFGGLKDSGCHNVTQNSAHEQLALPTESSRRIRGWADEDGEWHVSIDPVALPEVDSISGVVMVEDLAD